MPGPLNPCTAHYHDMHIKQLQAYAITGEATFETFGRRWSAYQSRLGGRLWAYGRKIAFTSRRRLR